MGLRSFVILTLLHSCIRAGAVDHLTPNFDFAPLSPDQLQFSADSQYFTSTANYDSEGGSFESLDDEHSFSEINTRLRGSYDLGPLTRAIAGVRVNYVTSIDETETRTNSELNELMGGLMYSPVYSLTHKVYLEIMGVLAMNEVAENDDTAITGEAANRLLLGARYSYLAGQIEFLGSLHFDYLQDGRSSRLPYSAGARIRFEDFWIFGSLYGFTSVTDDEFANTPAERDVLTSNVNAGSLRYYAVDPELLSSQVSLDWKVSQRASISFGIAKTLNGKNAAEGLSILGGLNFRWGGSDIIEAGTKKSRRRNRRVKRNNRAEEEEFQTSEEDYDEALFKERPKKKRRKKRKRRSRKPINLDEAIESTIDDLE